MCMWGGGSDIYSDGRMIDNKITRGDLSELKLRKCDDYIIYSRKTLRNKI